MGSGFSRDGTSPFGWAATCAGRRSLEGRDDVRALASSVERAWHHHFPRERGYVTQVSVVDGSEAVATFSATRGDFDARVTIEQADLESMRTDDRRARIRVYGRAASDTLLRTEQIADRRVARGRIVGATVGLLPFLGLAWLSLGESNPIFVLGGLLMVVALVTSVFVGATIGASFGERLAESLRRRARDSIANDPAVEHDLRRWKSLTRTLLAERAAFVSARGGQPFRREHVG